jgi:hypothetical protein
VLNRLEGLVWGALGIVIAFLSYRTGLGTFTEPGAGFVALASGLFLVVVGTVMAISRGKASSLHQAEEQGGQSGAQGTFPRRFFRLAYLISLLVFYGLVLEPAGYIITTFLFMFGLFLDLEKRRIAVPLLASLASVGVTYTVFEIWLKTQLPRGVFPWW